jgi:hypothetical protein
MKIVKFTRMKKSLLLVLFCLSLIGPGFGQWQKAKLPANNPILSLAVNYSTNYVYAGSAGNGVYVSADTGTSWKTANTGLPANLNVWNILVQNKDVFIATDSGVYVTLNNGINWEQAGMKGVRVKCLTCYNTGDSIFWYAGTDRGIYISKDNRLNWSLYALSGSGVSTLFSWGIAMYAGMTDGGLEYSTDYRRIWETADTGITTQTMVKSFDYGTAVWIPDIGTMLWSNTIVGTDHGIYVEKSNGNWVKVNSGLGSDTVVNSIISMQDIGNSGFFPITYPVLAGTGNGKGNVYLFKSSLRNYSWSPLATGIDGGVNALATFRNLIFAGGSGLWSFKSDLKYLYVLDSLGTLPSTGDTATIKIFSNDSWWISTYQYDWLTFSPNQGTGDATITVTVAPNTTGDWRFGSAMFTASGFYLYFYQDGGTALGINNTLSTSVSVYPVPVKDEMIISVPEKHEYTRFSIYDVSGTELLSSYLTGNATNVDMSKYHSGVYILKLYSRNTFTATRKIIKQ